MAPVMGRLEEPDPAHRHRCHPEEASFLRPRRPLCLTQLAHWALFLTPLLVLTAPHYSFPPHRPGLAVRGRGGGPWVPVVQA